MAKSPIPAEFEYVNITIEQGDTLETKLYLCYRLHYIPKYTWEITLVALSDWIIQDYGRKTSIFGNFIFSFFELKIIQVCRKNWNNANSWEKKIVWEWKRAEKRKTKTKKLSNEPSLRSVFRMASRLPEFDVKYLYFFANS